MSGLFYAVKSSISKKIKNNCSKVLFINKTLLDLYSRNKTKNNHDIKTNYFDNREHGEIQRKND